MANKQKRKYSLGFNTRDQIKALAGSAKRKSGVKRAGVKRAKKLDFFRKAALIFQCLYLLVPTTFYVFFKQER